MYLLEAMVHRENITKLVHSTQKMASQVTKDEQVKDKYHVSKVIRQQIRKVMADICSRTTIQAKTSLGHRDRTME